MRFAAHALGIVAADVERGCEHRVQTKGVVMAAESFFGNFSKTHAFDLCGCASEIFLHKFG